MSDRSSLRARLNPRIYLLAFATFAVGTEGYVVAGVLPDIGRAMHTSVSLAGQLVTIFALAYAMGGPPLIAVLRNVPPKKLLVGAMLASTASNLLSAAAPNYAALAAARVVAALSAALLAGPAAAAAAALSRPEDLPRAISVTATGNALALTLGAPIGTLIGGIAGWRGTFLFLAALGLVTAIALALRLPTVPIPAAGADRPRLWRKPAIRWSLMTTFGLFLAAYCTYTYLSPIATRATDLGNNGIAALMVVFGAGAIVAGRLVGHVLTRKPIDLVLRTALVLMAALLSILSALTAAHINSIAAFAAFPLLFCLGIVWCTGGVAQQTRIAAHAPLHRSQALGVHFSVQFLGVSVGGALGGLALSLGGPMTVPLVSALIAVASLLSVRLTTPAPNLDPEQAQAI